MKRGVREDRQWIRGNPEAYRQVVADGRVPPAVAARWEKWLPMSDEEFEAALDEHFPAGRRTEPGFWNDPAYNAAAQPVVGICWYEARAYCAWLSAQSGQRWRLPSEAEWEAAARGLTGRRYAWGDDFDPAFCNTFETHVRGTTPVGVFPAGDTPEGIADLSGNVWEWTSSAYHPYPYAADSRREDPALVEAGVLRGGSWLNSAGLARGSQRSTDHPGYRYYYGGFRVVSSAPIS